MRRRMAMLLALGLLVGVATSWGQGVLPGALHALVNSASAWLVLPFIAGSLMPSGRAAAVMGLGTCLLQLLGYDVTARLRGYPGDSGLIVFWALCAIAGGPIFGSSGRIWAVSPRRLSGLGAAVLAGAFLAEGTWTYLLQLHLVVTAVLWMAIGLGVAFLSARRRLSDLRWLGLTVPAGMIGEVLLTAVYRQSF